MPWTMGQRAGSASWQMMENCECSGVGETSVLPFSGGLWQSGAQSQEESLLQVTFARGCLQADTC